MITYMTKSGHKIEIAVYEHLGIARLRGYVDGQREWASVAVLLNKPVGDMVAALGRIGLTRGQYETIRTMQRKLQASISENLEIKHIRLISQRRDLVAALANAAVLSMDSSASVPEHQITGDINDVCIYNRALSDAEVLEFYRLKEKATAEEKLIIFDAAHPEVKRWIEKDRLVFLRRPFIFD